MKGSLWFNEFFGFCSFADTLKEEEKKATKKNKTIFAQIHIGTKNQNKKRKNKTQTLDLAMAMAYIHTDTHTGINKFQKKKNQRSKKNTRKRADLENPTLVIYH